MQTPISPGVQELTLRFESFSLSIRVEVTPNQIDTSLPSTVTSVELENLALAASTPPALGGFLGDLRGSIAWQWQRRTHLSGESRQGF